MTNKLLRCKWSDEECKQLHKKMLLQDYRIKNFVCGSENFIYLENSSVIVEGYKFYGSPYSLHEPYIKSACCSSTDTPSAAFKLKNDLHQSHQTWSNIPTDTEILLTHSPPFMLGDKNKQGFHNGCLSLLKRVTEEVRPYFHIFGHEQNSHGIYALNENDCETIFVNATSSDGRGGIGGKGYEAIVFDLPRRIGK